MPIDVRLEPEHLVAPAGSDVDGLILLTNVGDESAHVRVVVSGEVAGWATVTPGEFWIPAGADAALRPSLPAAAWRARRRWGRAVQCAGAL